MRTPKILIVDDERNIQIVLRKALEAEEYQISVVGSGQEAISMTKSERFDVIILDLRLPDMDGLQVLKEIDPVLNKLEVVMITAHGNIDVAVEAMKNGCVDFIQKPFDVEALRKVIDVILARKDISYENTIKFETLIEIAKIETKERRYTKAIKLAQEAIDLDPGNSEAYNFIGVLYEILEEFPKAIQAYQVANKLDPHNSNAKANLERVRNLNLGTGMIFG